MERLLVLDVDMVYQMQKMLHPSSIEGLTSVCSQVNLIYRCTLRAGVHDIYKHV